MLLVRARERAGVGQGGGDGHASGGGRDGMDGRLDTRAGRATLVVVRGIVSLIPTCLGTFSFLLPLYIHTYIPTYLSFSIFSLFYYSSFIQNPLNPISISNMHACMHACIRSKPRIGIHAQHSQSRLTHSFIHTRTQTALLIPLIPLIPLSPAPPRPAPDGFFHAMPCHPSLA